MVKLSNNQEIVSVSDINNLAKGLLEKELTNVWIQGEISSFTAHGSGHWYFTIKDKNSSLSCVMFKFENQNVLFDPKVGDELILNGNVSIYAPSGRYQFNVKHIEVFGEGALLKAFEDLKRKLEKEGLFEESAKKPIPALPLSVAVISSETGAVIEDIINVLGRRAPSLKLTLIKSKVQGKTADKEITKSIEWANRANIFDVVILARGGGSIEDLWCFNMESVAREIAKSKLPIISAVGHETDFTISDFVADLRAPTPSAAAEIISQRYSTLIDTFIMSQETLKDKLNKNLAQLKENLYLKTSLLKHPGDRLRETSQLIDSHEIRLKDLLYRKILEKKSNLQGHILGLINSSPANKINLNQTEISNKKSILINKINNIIEQNRRNYLTKISTLEAVNPLSVLTRGYSIVTNQSGKIISSSESLEINEEIQAEFKKGKVKAKVTEKFDNE